ncbi:exonuclease domain-containing protein [Neobacillus sp. C211]|jgi:DNA polymerase III subunit epsilon|uniref:DNA polymerase III subunit epsilon n=1 Tax=Priestia megaterium TaxID=1404 RepID=A0A6H1NZF6_PRIMG|nr:MULTISPECIES: exonuclease domain-containing protein [Bacillaceae]MBT2697475.1 DNA polymerase III subunit epsilon [Bacillus sp. ISL-40]MBT2720975.1 DNA polymerase III subunit epsilon [Bacillus sp. ISL-46]MBT2741709.1 DNA polymerase III subunit epsilon [Bacillus sp. ISL-77]QIZ06638.1 DNA polymerase III subunit epsilon [Priestia megaterium]SMQ64872.1 DNA polymerase-3 subunit epsilon [Bacillus sp. OV166]
MRSEKLGLVLDVETTGLGPTKDEVIELALKLFSYRADTGEVIDIIDEDSFLREPLSRSARNNYDTAYRVHGIPYELVQGKSFYDVKIKTYFHRADSVFAHNASFDRSFLYHMYPEVNDLKWYCTMRNIPWKNYGFPNGKLLTLLQAHNITNYQTHRALDDITYLLELLKKTSPNGNLYLQEVLEKAPMRKYQPAVSRTKMG